MSDIYHFGSNEYRMNEKIAKEMEVEVDEDEKKDKCGFDR